MNEMDRSALIDSACRLLSVVNQNGGATIDDYNVLDDIISIAKQMLDDLPK